MLPLDEVEARLALPIVLKSPLAALASAAPCALSAVEPTSIDDLLAVWQGLGRLEDQDLVAFGEADLAGDGLAGHRDLERGLRGRPVHGLGEPHGDDGIACDGRGVVLWSEADDAGRGHGLDLEGCGSTATPSPSIAPSTTIRYCVLALSGADGVNT